MKGAHMVKSKKSTKSLHPTVQYVSLHETEFAVHNYFCLNMFIIGEKFTRCVLAKRGEFSDENFRIFFNFITSASVCMLLSHVHI